MEDLHLGLKQLLKCCSYFDWWTSALAEYWTQMISSLRVLMHVFNDKVKRLCDLHGCRILMQRWRGGERG